MIWSAQATTPLELNPISSRMIHNSELWKRTMLSHTLDKPDRESSAHAYTYYTLLQLMTKIRQSPGHLADKATKYLFIFHEKSFIGTLKRCRCSKWMAKRRTKRQISDILGQAMESLDMISRKIFCNSTSGQIHSWGLDTWRWLTYSIRIKVNPASSHAVQYHKLPSDHTTGCDIHNHEHNSTGTLLQFNDISDVFWLFLHSASHCHYMSWGIIDWIFVRADCDSCCLKDRTYLEKTGRSYAKCSQHAG